MDNKIDFTWKIGGEAGFGIMVTGATFGKLCTRTGLHVVSTAEYPSLIRGGHNVFTVRAAQQKIYSLLKTLDVLICLNKETYGLHITELKENGILVFDPQDFTPDNKSGSLVLVPVAFLAIAKEKNGNLLMRNTVALGASMALLGIDFSLLQKVIEDQFIKKGQEIVDLNVNISKAGYEHVRSLNRKPLFNISESQEKKILATGNDSIAAGAISAGMNFFSAYPMTPINGLITYISEHEEKFNLIYKQPEDELAAINMAIGASYAGARAMTASSGGGFALMNEGFSMAGITETPLVVIYGQRPGPASGLPTWTSQGDLNYALNAGHGEFFRFVFTPGDLEEAFWLTKLAFNLTDQYQTPAIVLVDKYLCESAFSCDPEVWQKPEILPNSIWEKAKTINLGKRATGIEANYQRYQITEDGISPRAIPGKGTAFTVNSYEHTPDGLSTEIGAEIKTMIDKRNRKGILAQNEAFGPIEYGDKNAELTLVGWGSTKQAVLESINVLLQSNDKLKVRYLHFPVLSPFPVENTKFLLGKSKKIINVEGNSQAQLSSLIRAKTGIEITENILKYDGRQFYPEEIISALKVINSRF